LPIPPDTDDFGDPYVPAPTPEANPPNSGAASLDPLTYQPNELTGLDSDGNPASIELPKLQMTQSFIDFLWVAILEGSRMDKDEIRGLHEPRQGHKLLDPSQLVCSIQHFLNNTQSSHKHYETLQRIKLMHNPDNVILSFNQVKH
jgi:hypothetical protein